jgi:hypothetical protein
MLRRQQATAVVAARFQIVHGAVSMVEMALHQLAEKNVVALDDERESRDGEQPLVVLCSEHSRPRSSTPEPSTREPVTRWPSASPSSFASRPSCGTT